MTNILLKDILITAREEANRMRHYYLGVEHLFIAMLRIRGSVTSKILEEFAESSEHVTDSIRRKVGKGSKNRLWAGIPNTPRAEIILTLAGEIALQNGRKKIEEVDLLTAILDEGDNVPIRVLEAIEIDIKALRAKLKEIQQEPVGDLPTVVAQSFVKIDFSQNFSDEMVSQDHLFILRRMFQGYKELHIDDIVQHKGKISLSLIVTPILEDSLEKPVIVKIGYTEEILDEVRHFEQQLGSGYPPGILQLSGKPITPELSDYTGIQFALTSNIKKPPQKLSKLLFRWERDAIADWLKNSFHPTFRERMWFNNRPYHFMAWREYDYLLPPILTIEYLDKAPETARVRKIDTPFQSNMLKQIKQDDVVNVQKFVVERTDRENKILVLSAELDTNIAYMIEVHNVDFEKYAFYHGEIVDELLGQVLSTRESKLSKLVESLEPDFDINKPTLERKGITFFNPLQHYQDIVNNYHVLGSKSIIHSNLNIENILVDDNKAPILIDFSRIHDGHTLFDFASLEVSILLSDLIASKAEESWDGLWDLVHQISNIGEIGLGKQEPKRLTADTETYIKEALKQLNAVDDNDETVPPPQIDSVLQVNLKPILAIRELVEQSLSTKGNWAEYYVALALHALHQMVENKQNQHEKRFMYLVSGYALQELKRHGRPNTQVDTQEAVAPDDTQVDD